MTRQEARDNSWLVGRCAKCIFWKRAFREHGKDKGQPLPNGACRRHSQQLALWSDHDSSGQVLHYSDFDWPNTKEDDWCGDAVWSMNIEEKK